MKICPDPVQKQCRIWLSHQESARCRADPAFRQICRSYRAQGYQVCVYAGGQEPLLPHVTALLRRQDSLV
ncbi:hypothetical protein [Pseudoflavonifractor phocaeensis]|uniref:hypothetical protein n=1 Tax=Pseudoflavonifractor phocaeensis TaxID=1870988 RepID=UPI00195A59A9|nr:hypothetical protein [Pseudoflavonifractor phocaeensis]MBM6870884.1 hypothetical protein [Pseudoflavonifractor phocaeensis]